jgi:hypothetical protein
MQFPAEALELRAEQHRVGTNVFLGSVRVRRVQALQVQAIRLDVLKAGHSLGLPEEESV